MADHWMAENVPQRHRLSEDRRVAVSVLLIEPMQNSVFGAAYRCPVPMPSNSGEVKHQKAGYSI
jgi:hypothetical protein